MKKLFSLMAILLSISLCIGCIGSDEEDEISSGIEDDGTGRIPSQSELEFNL